MRMKSAARVEEAGERRRKRNRAARRQPHRRADHHLLGDEVLVEAIGKRLLELVAEGRVLHVGVERDDARVGFAELRERRAVRLARRDLRRPACRRAARPASARRGGRGARRRLGESAAARFTPVGAGHELLLELGERPVELLALLERPAVPAVLALRRTTRPLPLIVRARIIVGRPLRARAPRRARRECAPMS